MADAAALRGARNFLSEHCFSSVMLALLTLISRLCAANPVVDTFLKTTEPVEDTVRTSFPNMSSEASLKVACAGLGALHVRGLDEQAAKLGFACVGGRVRAAIPKASGNDRAVWKASDLVAAAVALNDEFDALQSAVRQIDRDSMTLLRAPLPAGIDPARKIREGLAVNREVFVPWLRRVTEVTVALARTDGAPREIVLAAARMAMRMGDCAAAESLAKPGAVARERDFMGTVQSLCQSLRQPPCGDPIPVGAAANLPPVAAALIRDVGDELQARMDASCILSARAPTLGWSDGAAVPDNPPRPGALERLGQVARAWPQSFEGVPPMVPIKALDAVATPIERESVIEVLSALAALSPGNGEFHEVLKGRVQAQWKAGQTSGGQDDALHALAAVFAAANVESLLTGEFGMAARILQHDAAGVQALFEAVGAGMAASVREGFSCTTPAAINLQGGLCELVDRAAAQLPGDLVRALARVATAPSADMASREISRFVESADGLLRPLWKLRDLKGRVAAFDRAFLDEHELGRLGRKAADMVANPSPGGLEGALQSLLDWAEGEPTLFQMKVVRPEGQALALSGVLALARKDMDGVGRLQARASRRFAELRSTGAHVAEWKDMAMAAAVLTRIHEARPQAERIGSDLLDAVQGEMQRALPGKAPRHLAGVCAMGLSLLPAPDASMATTCGDLDPGSMAAVFMASAAEESLKQKDAALDRLLVANILHQTLGGDDRGEVLLMRRLASMARGFGNIGLADMAQERAGAAQARIDALSGSTGGGIGTLVSEVWARQWQDIERRTRAAKVVASSRTVHVLRQLFGRIGAALDRFDPFAGVTAVARVAQGSFQVSLGRDATGARTIEMDISGIMDLVPVEPGWLAPLPGTEAPATPGTR